MGFENTSPFNTVKIDATFFPIPFPLPAPTRDPTQGEELKNVHFVGGIPLNGSNEVFRTLCNVFPGRLKRIPDGNTGQRRDSDQWQSNIFQSAGLAHIVKSNPLDSTRDFEEIEFIYTLENLFTIDPKYVLPAICHWHTSRSLPFDPRYDDFAIESYLSFSAQRAAGIIPYDVKFQICIPDIFQFVSLWVEQPFRHHIYPIYQAGWILALSRLQAEIPHYDLSIQFDINTPASDSGVFEPSLNNDPVARTALLIDAIAPDVEIGFHLSCREGVVQPYQMQAMANLASLLQSRIRRRVAWIHVSIPAAANNESYFTPLRALMVGEGDNKTELYLGLARARDLVGTVQRMRIAAKALGAGDFGIATDKGFEDIPMEEFEDILRVLETASRM